MAHKPALTALALAGALALTTFAPAGVAPALAQDDAMHDCTPGVFGEGGTYRTRRGDDDRVTTAIIEFQCGDTLSDGTFIPTGYRVQLEGQCDGSPCNYPMVMAEETAREGVFNANLVLDGKNVVIRVRQPRRGNGVNVVVTRRAPERGAERDRASYRMRAAGS